jgi:dTDP-4-dehydrorhamnose reductase
MGQDEILERNKTAAGRQIVAAGTYSTRPESLPAGVEALHMDMRDPDSVAKCVSAFKPDVVINLAALSSPAACEKSKEEAEALNSPGCLLDSMLQTVNDALLIHVSTDQIFDGSSPVYTEASAALPVNTYGATKLLFEEHIKARWANHVILRSSLIYGPAPPRPCSRKDTFLQFLDGALAKDAELSLFHDEVRCPIYVTDVVAIILAFLSPDAFKVCTNTAKNGGLEERTFNMGGPQRLSRVQVGRAKFVTPL